VGRGRAALGGAGGRWRGLAGPELLAAKLAEHRRAGVLALRDAGSVFDVDDPAVLATGEPLVIPDSPLAHLFPGVPASEAPAAAAARARAGSGWVKLLIDVPDPSPLTPTLSYPPSVVREIGATVREVGGWLREMARDDPAGGGAQRS
jgi:hypothetical protein